MSIFQDIRTAVRLTGEVRKARKSGASGVELRTFKIMPITELAPCFLNTPEGCQCWQCGRDTYQTVKGVFDALPYETRRQLECTPAPGEWVERVEFWRQQLKPVLPEKTYHTVMMKFINWYAHCLRRRIEKGVMA